MSSESNYSFTTKHNGQDLFTVRGDSFDEFLSNLMLAAAHPGIASFAASLDGSGVAEQQAINTVVSSLGATVISTPTPVMANQVASTPAPSAEGKSCIHGKMTAKQGVGKDGKTWRGYMCPAPQGAADKCKNVYIYPNQPEWFTFVAG